MPAQKTGKIGWVSRTNLEHGVASLATFADLSLDTRRIIWPACCEKVAISLVPSFTSRMWAEDVACEIR